MQAIWKDLIFQGLFVHGAARYTLHITLHMHNISAKLYHRYHSLYSKLIGPELMTAEI